MDNLQTANTNLKENKNMYLNQFSVRIPEGNEIQGGYVEIDDGIQYRLVLRNDRDTRCDARVEIDGKHVGTWRIREHNSITLERPAKDDGHFTFYIAGSENARKAGIEYSNPDLGLVRVTFTPEKKVRPTVNVNYPNTLESGATSRSVSFGMSASAPVSKGVAGGTGLSGHSSQKFYQASSIKYDYSQQTTINLRMVGKSGDPRPLVNASSNPVPPRVW